VNSATSYSFNLTPGAQGAVTVDIAANAGTDTTTGLGTLAATQFSRTFDTVVPTADIVDVSPDPRNNAVGAVSITFSESVTGVSVGDFSLTRGGSAVTLTAGMLSGSGSSYSLDLSTVSGTAGTYVL